MFHCNILVFNYFNLDSSDVLGYLYLRNMTSVVLVILKCNHSGLLSSTNQQFFICV